MNKKQQKSLDSIMDWFDWDRCAAMMTVDGRFWYPKDYGDTPHPAMIKQWARNRFTEMVEEKHSFVSSGGFEFIKDKNEFTLRFVPEEAVGEVDSELENEEV